MNKQLLTARELAKILNKHEQTIYRWARCSVIPSHKLQGALFFDLREIEDKIKGKGRKNLAHIGVDLCI